MKQVGAKLGIGFMVALLCTAVALGAPAYGRGHHHHHHHHHAGGGGGGGTPTTPAPTNACAAAPQTATMTLDGSFSTTVSCHGLSPLEAITIDSLLLRLNCAAVTFSGTVPPLVLTTDAGGNLSFGIAGFDCLAGNYSVQGVGVIDNLDFPLSTTF